MPREKYIWLKNTERIQVIAYAIDKEGRQIMVQFLPKQPKRVPEYYIYQDDFRTKLKDRNDKQPILKVVDRPLTMI